MMMENEGPESLIKYGRFLNHIHIAEKEERAAPGVHGEDFTPYLKALKHAGYEGSISIECHWDNLETQAEIALITLKKQLAAI
jgi:sugar phosphate isomerase/epimerase